MLVRRSLNLFPVIKKALLYRVAEDGCISHLIIPNAPLIFGLLMTASLLLGAPAAIAQTKYVEGEVIVGFLSSSNQTQIESFESRNKLKKVKSFPNIHAVQYRIESGQTTGEAIEVLSKEPIVEYVEPNWIHERQAKPTDPEFHEQWHLNNIGQMVNGVEGTTGIDINWLAANDLFSGTQDIVVAVVDSGVAFDHPEFIDKLWLNPHDHKLDGIDDDGNGYNDDLIGWDFYDKDGFPLDENSHGTLVASLIAAKSGNGKGGVGVSSKVKLMPLRAGNDMGNLTSSAIIEAFTYAGKKGANIINASFGSTAYSSAQYAIIQWLRSKGVLVVAAAGNGGNDGKGDNNDISPSYPASYPLDNIISVAAVNQHGQLATFSNYGPSKVHIAAPGINIFGASPAFSTAFYDSFETDGAGWVKGHLPDSRSPFNWSIYEDGFGRHWLTDSLIVWNGAMNYAPYTDSFARTPLISVGYAQLLTYKIWYQLEYSYDWLLVEASSDGGASWTMIDYVTGYSSYSSCPTCTLDAGTLRSVDLSSFNLQNKNFYIRFRLISDGDFNYAGVYLDEVTIKQIVPFSYDGTQYQYKDGTSFSAPLVTGVAALIWSQRPDFTYSQVRDVILNSARSLTTLQGKILTGGMVDAYASLQSAIAVPQGLTLSTQELYFSGTRVGMSSPTQSITLTNAGTSSINLSQFFTNSNSDFDGTYLCPATLVPGQTCYLDLHMSPTSTGERDGVVQIVSDAPGSPHVIRLLGLATAAPTQSPFMDVPFGYWADNYIMGIYNAGFTMGCSQAPLMYCPENPVTRDQMAAFVIRAKEGEPAANYCASGIPFSDVSTSGWACPYIKRLYELGITTGYGGAAEYRPELTVTREQMAAFIIRAKEGEPAATYCDSGSPFSDVSSSSWSCKYVKRLYELGITTGYGGTDRYEPGLTVTRAQMSAFLSRAFLGMR